jgi:predicted Zn-ribbon and HTH transcriptional regulator
MADVYKFRVTVDLELATHESPKNVRDFLKAFVEEGLSEFEPSRSNPVDAILTVNVRTKRLDDDASIDPPVLIRLKNPKCPHCGHQHLGEVVTDLLPVRCPQCRKVIPIDAEGRVR